MKKHLPIWLPLLIFIFYSCEKTDIQDINLNEGTEKKDPSLKMINFSNTNDYEFLRTKLITANKSFEKNSESLSIDTTTVNLIETSDYSSYTFRIRNNVALQNKVIQNLVISKSSYYKGYKYHLFEYFLNENQYLQVLNGEGATVELLKASNIKQLPDLQFDSFIPSKSQYTCYVEVTSYEFCGHEGHEDDHLDGTCSHPVRVTQYLEATCDSGGDGGGNVTSPEEPGTSGPGDIYSPGGGGDSSGPSSSGGDTTISAPLGPEGEVLIDWFLVSLLETNPFLLLQINCDQIPEWFNLATDQASQAIKDKINGLPRTLFNAFALQTLNGANGTIANMDYFAVKVTTFPKKPGSQIRYTANEFLDYIRREINTLVNNTTFSPYCEISSLCTPETTLWNSNDPTGALIYIDINVDPGVVICSEFQNNFWRFKTLNAPGAGNHPVSGTREFGYEQNTDGSYNFYVRGVDRFDSNLIENAAYMTSAVVGTTLRPNPFYAADELWESFQAGIDVYVNSRGGVAITQPPVTLRPDWDLLKQVLEGTKPISALGCE